MENRDGAVRWKSIHIPENISLYHLPLNVSNCIPFLQSDPMLNSCCTVTTLPVK
jgi:hypothetical protein